MHLKINHFQALPEIHKLHSADIITRILVTSILYWAMTPGQQH